MDENLLPKDARTPKTVFGIQREGRLSIGIIGLGTSTLGILDYIRRLGDEIRIVIRQKGTPDLSHLPPLSHVEVRSGERYLDGIGEDVLVLSPSVRRDSAPIADAIRRGIKVTTDVEIFFSHTAGEVFAITGSDGKSTTTAITARLLRAGGCFERVSACGNIGRAATPLLDGDTERCGYAFELSSFQLMDITPEVRRGVITNLTPNHLNWHKGMAEYAEAKRHLLVHCREAVLPLDCPALFPLYDGIKPYAVFSARADEGELAAYKADIAVGIRDGWIRKNGVPFLPLSQIRLPGRYNILNYMAAICLTDGFCDSQTVREVAREWGGMPHRAEWLGRVEGVDCIDSSIDSSPARTAATLSAMNKRVILLVGGRGKGVPFDALIEPIAEHAKAVITSGEVGDEIFRLLDGSETVRHSGVRVLREKTLGDAIRCARSVAKAGDAILLSPAATSFDEFGNFEERGDFFRAALGLTNRESG